MRAPQLPAATRLEHSEKDERSITMQKDYENSLSAFEDIYPAGTSWKRRIGEEFLAGCAAES